MNTIKTNYHNHYEVASIDGDWNPHLVLDTKNPIVKGDIVQLCSEKDSSHKRYVVEKVVHYLVHVAEKGTGQYYHQVGSWNTVLYVKMIQE